MVKKRYAILFIALIIILLLSILVSSLLGRFTMSIGEAIQAVWIKLSFSRTDTFDNAINVLFEVRFPRIFVAIGVGMALSAAGASYQGLFRNPMVSPDILGVSSGACFGASIAILLEMNKFGIQMMAFVFGIGAVSLTYLVSKIAKNKSQGILMLVLAGMVTESIFSALLSSTKYLADSEDKLPAITFWLMGSLASVTSKDVKLLMILLCIGYIPLYLVRWKINVMACGEEEAQAMGLNTKRLQLLIVGCSTLLAAASVSIAGKVGWIGLIVPHIARLLVGPDYKRLLPVTALIGGIFLLIVDDLCRTLILAEVPLGILTSLCGAPFFLYLLIKGKDNML